MKALSQLNNQKAPGPTRVLVTILDSIDVLVRLLTFIMNQLFEQGIFPEILKIVQVLSIDKKEDTVNVSKYHPISLSSVLSKIFEKAMY